jgi:hypothetical protein
MYAGNHSTYDIRKQGSQVNKEELALASVFFQNDSQQLAEVARAA